MKRICSLMLLAFVMLGLCMGCVDQSKEAPVKPKDECNRIIATSIATAEVCDKLNLDLVGVPHSDISANPTRYRDLPEVGLAMTPDLEIIKSLDPDIVLSPVSLISDLLPKYEKQNIPYGFLNLTTLQGMFATIEDMGTYFDREDEAAALVKDYQRHLQELEKNRPEMPPKVLILMGLPGSYVVATPHSYVGDLVQLAGGDNVYADQQDSFVNINVEDMLQKDPDIILRAAHALPDDVKDMFQEEFQKNDTWKHFRAVKEGRVYDLDYDKFGMSAKFNYPEALKDLEAIYHEDR